MNELEEGREKITQLMLAQAKARAGARSGATPPPGDRALPLRIVYVDEAARQLIVGLEQESAAERGQHLRQLREIVGDIGLDVRYVTVGHDACPNKAQQCSPIRGGIQMAVPSPLFPGAERKGTLSLVGEHIVGSEHKPFTIVSAHLVGSGLVDRIVGQPWVSTPYGTVIRNPALNGRSSDAALTDLTPKLQHQMYRIWAGPDDQYYKVVGFGGDLELDDLVYMQGATSQELETGNVFETDITINDPEFGTQLHQVGATYGRESGDSGAPVFTLDVQNMTAVYRGIHAGHYTEDGEPRAYFSAWRYITSELQVTPVNVPAG